MQAESALQVIEYEDFEMLRCDKCKEYLNVPNIMIYIDPNNLDKPYTECGRCYKETDQPENLPKPIRNISAETLAAVTPFPCKFYSNGCKQRRVWPQIQVHEQECKYRLFECFLFSEQPMLLTSIEIVQKCKMDYPNLYLIDGVIPLQFNEDLEKTFLVEQNLDLFMCRIKYDAVTGKAVFIINFMEVRNNALSNIEITNTNTKKSLNLRMVPTREGTTVDFKAVRSLLDDPDTLKCRIYVNRQLLPHSLSELIKEIQCPSCWDYMTGRIFMCSNGHNVCAECKKSLEGCPICREGVIQSGRNISLEKVISQAFFPCKNHEEGCSYISNIEEVINHQRNCEFDSDEDDM